MKALTKSVIFSRREKLLLGLLGSALLFSFSFSYGAVNQSKVDSIMDIITRGGAGFSDVARSGQSKSDKTAYYEQVDRGLGEAVEMLAVVRNNIRASLGLSPAYVAEDIIGGVLGGVIGGVGGNPPVVPPTGGSTTNPIANYPIPAPCPTNTIFMDDVMGRSNGAWIRRNFGKSADGTNMPGHVYRLNLETDLPADTIYQALTAEYAPRISRNMKISPYPCDFITPAEEKKMLDQRARFSGAGQVLFDSTVVPANTRIGNCMSTAITNNIQSKIFPVFSDTRTDGYCSLQAGVTYYVNIRPSTFALKSGACSGVDCIYDLLDYGTARGLSSWYGKYSQYTEVLASGNIEALRQKVVNDYATRGVNMDGFIGTLPVVSPPPATSTTPRCSPTLSGTLSAAISASTANLCAVGTMTNWGSSTTSGRQDSSWVCTSGGQTSPLCRASYTPVVSAPPVITNPIANYPIPAPCMAGTALNQELMGVNNGQWIRRYVKAPGNVYKLRIDEEDGLGNGAIQTAPYLGNSTINVKISPYPCDFVSLAEEKQYGNIRGISVASSISTWWNNITVPANTTIGACTSMAISNNFDYKIGSAFASPSIGTVSATCTLVRGVTYYVNITPSHAELQMGGCAGNGCSYDLVDRGNQKATALRQPWGGNISSLSPLISSQNIESLRQTVVRDYATKGVNMDGLTNTTLGGAATIPPASSGGTPPSTRVGPWELENDIFCPTDLANLRLINPNTNPNGYDYNNSGNTFWNVKSYANKADDTLPATCTTGKKFVKHGMTATCYVYECMN